MSEIAEGMMTMRWLLLTVLILAWGGLRPRASPRTCAPDPGSSNQQHDLHCKALQPRTLSLQN